MILDESADDYAEDDSFSVGPAFMWLTYAECARCGAAAKAPCVGQRFGPHEGRLMRWEKDRAEWDAGGGSGAD